MWEWIINNLATIIISAVLLLIVVSIIVKLVNDRKKGKTSCGCGCENCPSSSACHKQN